MKLDSYFFTNQEVKANPAHDTSAKIEVSTKLNIQANRIEDMQNAIAIETTICLDEAKSENSPYLYNITAFGVFIFDEEIVTDEMTSLIAPRGASILIGALRERLAELTSRGPWKAVLLSAIQLKTVAAEDTSKDGDP